MELILSLATRLGGIAAVWFFWDKLSSWLKYSEGRWERLRKEMFSELSQPEYLDWQQKILETVYEGLEFAAVYGKKYPAAILRSSPGWQYPFKDLCELSEIRPPALHLNKEQKAYIKLLGSSLKWPLMKGFALKRINLDDQDRVTKIKAVTINFLQNLATSHILEWELFQCYTRTKSNPIHLDVSYLLKQLPNRALYHNGRKGRFAIYEPGQAYPLLSVQAMVVFRDTRQFSESDWKIVTAVRSNDVVVKPGFFQFQPAGGFEVYGSEEDDNEYLVQQGFDLTTALFREYAEELFDAKHLQFRSDSRDPMSVLSDPNVYQLIELINESKASIHYLGIIVDLAVLRHELSFLIVIEDEKYCKNEMLGSWEAKNIIGIAPDNLQTFLSSGMLHSSSAGLLQLAIESEKLQELGISNALCST